MTNREEEKVMTTEAEVVVAQSLAKECLQPPEAIRGSTWTLAR